MKLCAVAVAGMVVAASAHCTDLPTLPDTNLFKTYAHDCKTVDLATWVHPTRTVLERYKIAYTRLDLCNANTYPIFYVRIRYDPMLDTTDSFFLPFYAAMWKANGRNPMGFIVTSSNETIELNDSGGLQPLDLHEQFRN